MERGRADLDPFTLDFEPGWPRSWAQLRQLDPDLGDFALLDETRLHIDVSMRWCRYERSRKRR